MTLYELYRDYSDSDRSRAMEYAELFLSRVDSTSSSPYLAPLYDDLAEWYEMQEYKFSSAIKWRSRLLSNYEANEDSYHCALTRYHLAKLYLKKGQYHRTLRLATEAAEYFRNSGDDIDLMECYKLEAFNAAVENAEWPVEAVTGIAEYREKVPAPEGTSDWYVASPKELKLLVTGPTDGNIWNDGHLGGSWTSDKTVNRDLVNEKMQAIDGAMLLGGADAPVTYWGSAEITAERAITCFFSFASTSGDSKKDTQYETNFRVRYILAF